MTFTLHFACKPLIVFAVIVAVPAFLAVTSPVLLTVTTEELLLLHVIVLSDAF